MAARPRVLVAGTRLGIDLVREVLGGDAELAGAQSVTEALAEVERGVELPRQFGVVLVRMRACDAHTRKAEPAATAVKRSALNLSRTGTPT